MANLIDTDAKTIAERNEGFGHPSICRVSGGRIYTAHILDSGNLEIHYSDDTGSSWTLDTTFSPNSGNINIDMFSFVISDLDDIFLTYCEDEGLDYYTLKVLKRDHISGTWSEILEENTIQNVGTILQPLINWNRYESNRLHIFWQRHLDAAGSWEVDIYNKYSDNYGSSWTNGGDYPKVLEYNSDIQCTSDIDTDPVTGDVYILRYRTAAYIKLHQIKYNSIGTYQNNTDIGANLRKHYGAKIVITDTGDIWIAKYGEVSNWYDAIIYKNGVQSLVFGNVQFSDSIKRGMFALGLDGDNNIYLFFTKSDDKAYYYKYDNDSSSWGSETSLTAGEGLRIGSEKFSLIVSDKLHVVYYTT